MKRFIVMVFLTLLLCSCSEKHEGIPHCIVAIVEKNSEVIESVDECQYHSEIVYLMKIINTNHIRDFSLDYVILNDKGYTIGESVGTISGIGWTDAVADFPKVAVLTRRIWWKNQWTI